MGEAIYGFLTNYGYHHPAHAVLTHLPVGLTMGGVIFLFLAFITRSKSLGKTATHCFVLALVAVIPTVLMGLVDWRHFYGGAMISPIINKMVLAGLLALFLIGAVWQGRGDEFVSGRRMFAGLLCLVTVSLAGYFGGELVYGGKKASVSAPKVETAGEAVEDAEKKVADPPVAVVDNAGQTLFAESCGACHFADSTDPKVGPGLKGLFQMDGMPTSRKPVTEDNIRAMLKAPVDEMPAFEDLSGEALTALMGYLKQL